MSGNCSPVFLIIKKIFSLKHQSQVEQIQIDEWGLVSTAADLSGRYKSQNNSYKHFQVLLVNHFFLEAQP